MTVTGGARPEWEKTVSSGLLACGKRPSGLPGSGTTRPHDERRMQKSHRTRQAAARGSRGELPVALAAQRTGRVRACVKRARSPGLSLSPCRASWHRRGASGLAGLWHVGVDPNPDFGLLQSTVYRVLVRITRYSPLLCTRRGSPYVPGSVERATVGPAGDRLQGFLRSSASRDVRCF